MSIDNFIWVPAGARDDKSIGYRKYKFWKGVLAAETSTVPRHQVFLAHGANVLIDDQYFFEDPQDARWFWEEGYNERLFLLDEEEGESAGYDQMSLWIDGALLAQREYAGRIWVYRRIRTRTAKYDEVSNRHDRHGGEEMKHVGRGKRWFKANNMNNVKAGPAACSNAVETTAADLEQVRNAANANEAFEVTWSWGWSYPQDTRRIVLAKNLLDAVQYVLHDVEADPVSDESNSITARMIQSAEDIKNADVVVDARDWYARPSVRPQMKLSELLPFGWEIRETNGTFELWDRGRFYDDRATLEEALELIAEIEDGRPEK